MLASCESLTTTLSMLRLGTLLPSHCDPSLICNSRSYLTATAGRQQTEAMGVLGVRGTTGGHTDHQHA